MSKFPRCPYKAHCDNILNKIHVQESNPYRDEGWDDDAECECEWEVVAVLEHDDGVVVEVAQVDLGPLLLHVGVLPDHQPSDLKQKIDFERLS